MKTYRFISPSLKRITKTFTKCQMKAVLQMITVRIEYYSNTYFAQYFKNFL